MRRIAFKRRTMIDMSEEVLSASSKSSRRRAPNIAATRAGKRHEAGTRTSLAIERVFSDAKLKPFDQIEWERRTAEITDDAGKVIFKQENVEVPRSWSVLATKV